MMYAMVIITIILSIMIGLCWHEYGHMVRARKHGVTVKKYVIGFGKPFIKWQGKKHPETTYGIAPLPFGGYCDIDAEQLDALSYPKYVDVLSAGVIRNFIFGFILSVIGTALILGLTNPIDIVKSTVEVIFNGFSNLIQSIGLMFNPKEIAAYGGITSQFGATGTQIVGLGLNITKTIGVSLLTGGIMNIIIGIFNLLPIPAIDGGQIIVTGICVLFKRLFNYEISNKIIMRINTFFFGLLMVYQILIFLMDFEPVRQFFLNL